MLIKVMLIAAVAIFLAAYPHDGMAQGIPCSGAPSEAMVEVPENIRDLAAVSCTKYGHFLTGADGTIWTYPGAMAPALLIAYLEAADSKEVPPEVNHSKYFSSIQVRNVPSADAVALLSNDDGLPKPPVDSPIAAIEISAKNQDGVVQKAYIFSSGTSRWGYLCDPTCKPDNTFMVLDMRRPGGGT
jgi:hypothetical protein